METINVNMTVQNQILTENHLTQLVHQYNQAALIQRTNLAEKICDMLEDAEHNRKIVDPMLKFAHNAAILQIIKQELLNLSYDYTTIQVHISLLQYCPSTITELHRMLDSVIDMELAHEAVKAYAIEKGAKVYE